MAVVELHDIGSNQEGVDGASLKNTPTDNGNYYTFNGSDNGLYWGSDWGDETTIDIKAKIRVHDKDKGSEQVFWKSGGSGNGIAIGIDSDGGLGIFGRASSNRTSIEIASSSYSNNVWYYLYATSSGVILQEVDHLYNYVEQVGTITPGNGTDNESIGFSRTSCPINGTVADTSYFDGDVDYIELYTAGTLHFTPSLYYFSGYVYEENTSNPVSRKVYCYRRDDGSLIASTTSSGNGYYYLETTYSGSHFLIALDDDVGETYNLVGLDYMIPTTVS